MMSSTRNRLGIGDDTKIRDFNARGIAELMVDWIVYFCETTLTVQKNAKAVVRFILKKPKFLDQHHHHFNDRQLKVILKMFDNALKGLKVE